MADLEEPYSDESRPILLDDYSESESSLCCFFLQVVIILGFSSLVIWVSVTPKSPIYLITNAYIPALDARNYSTSIHSHNTSFFLNLEFFNPNKKMSINYSDISITLYYSTSSTDADLIGSSSLPGFHQGYKETTPYEVVVNADQQLWKGNINITMNGTKEFKVCMENHVKYKIVGLIKVKHQYRIYKEAYMSVDSNGEMIRDLKNIKLHHTSKMTKRH